MVNILKNLYTSSRTGHRLNGNCCNKNKYFRYVISKFGYVLEDTRLTSVKNLYSSLGLKIYTQLEKIYLYYNTIIQFLEIVGISIARTIRNIQNNLKN